ncbi:MAG: tRNA pseudouridine55 synthase [Desulfomicrobiaceae bacterium]|jgi:tRNA pseudouridine55 synthase|nr:tRNA pseudouridine55 synthase [Desulfomicrobiaceae bacterium]MDK2872943.1 tRNA pseudouridine55 synthase [Desulfomicrobiaceae bacterium]
MQQHGILIVAKPPGLTSAQVTNRIKRLGQRKIGHAGTLDPMATGVLVVLLGHGTKLAEHLNTGTKVYRGVLRLGLTTDTYDREGSVTSEAPWQHIEPDSVRRLVLSWTELTEQEVPPVSAAKHGGKPGYLLVRQGITPPAKTKPITVFSAQVLRVDLPRVEFRVTCSTGTYVRSLAHSLGMRLGCGAVLEELEREACHPFTLDQALSLEEILAAGDDLGRLVIPLAEALPHWPRLIATEAQASMVRQGQMLPAGMFPGVTAAPGDKALMLDSSGAALALMQAKIHGKTVVWRVLRGLW